MSEAKPNLFNRKPTGLPQVKKAAGQLREAIRRVDAKPNVSRKRRADAQQNSAPFITGFFQALVSYFCPKLLQFARRCLVVCFSASLAVHGILRLPSFKWVCGVTISVRGDRLINLWPAGRVPPSEHHLARRGLVQKRDVGNDECQRGASALLMPGLRQTWRGPDNGEGWADEITGS